MQEMKLVRYRDGRGNTIRYDLTLTAQVSLTPFQLLNIGWVQFAFRTEAGLELKVESQAEWDDVLRRLVAERDVVRAEGEERA